MFKNLDKGSLIVSDILIENVSHYKFSILKLLKKESLSISEIGRKIDISYKEAHRHVRELEKDKWIKTEKKIKQKHSPVITSITEQGLFILDLVNSSKSS